MSSPPVSPIAFARSAVAAARDRLLAALAAPTTTSALLASTDSRRELEHALAVALETFGAVVFDALECGALQLEPTAAAAEPVRVSRVTAEPPFATPARVERPAAADTVPSAPAGPARPTANVTSDAPPSPALGLLSPRTQVTPVPAVQVPAVQVPAVPVVPAAPALPVVPPAPPVPVTPAMLERLRDKLGSTLSQGPDAVARTLDPHELEIVRDGIIRLGSTPSGLESHKALGAELDILERAAHEFRRWGRLPAPANHALTTWMVSRARALQDALDAKPDPVISRRTDALFRQMTEHSSTSRPGKVHGLARTHVAQASSWANDSREAERVVMRLVGAGPIELPVAPRNFDDDLRRLTEEVRAGLSGTALVDRMRRLVADGLSPQEPRVVRLATTVISELEGLNALNRLRKAAMRLADEETEQETDAAVREHVPTNWPHWELVRGKSVVIVGGEPRAERVARLKEAFGFGGLEWLDGAAASGKNVDSLVRRMRSGNVQIVIVLRAFSSHKLSDKVFKFESEKCVRVLADTYGVLQVRLGLERFLVGKPA